MRGSEDADEWNKLKAVVNCNISLVVELTGTEKNARIGLDGDVASIVDSIRFQMLFLLMWDYLKDSLPPYTATQLKQALQYALCRIGLHPTSIPEGDERKTDDKACRGHALADDDTLGASFKAFKQMSLPEAANALGTAKPLLYEVKTGDKPVMPCPKKYADLDFVQAKDCKKDTKEDEAWKQQGMEGKVKQYLNFWLNWLGAKATPNAQTNPRADVSEDCLKRWLCLIRAVSWAESLHGTGTGNQPARDPMQIGNPADAGWKALKGVAAQPEKPYREGDLKGVPDFKDVPGRIDEDAKGIECDKVPDSKAVGEISNIPANSGHKDQRFTKELSYFWGILWLIQKVNNDRRNADCTIPNNVRSTWNFQCCSWDDLIHGAAYGYNAKPGKEEDYKTKITNALEKSCCRKAPPR